MVSWRSKYLWKDNERFYVKMVPCPSVNGHLKYIVVLSALGHTDDPTITPCQSLKQSLLNILDRAIWEMENRISKKNVEPMTVMTRPAPIECNARRKQDWKWLSFLLENLLFHFSNGAVRALPSACSCCHCVRWNSCCKTNDGQEISKWNRPVHWV